MSITNDDEAQPFWDDLAADPQYAELAQYVADKKKKHRDDLAEFRDSVSPNLPPEAKDSMLIPAMVIALIPLKDTQDPMIQTHNI